MRLNIKFVDPLDGTIYEFSSTEELANAIGIEAGDVTVAELERKGFTVGNANSVYWIAPQLPIEDKPSSMPQLEGIEFIKSSLSNDIDGLQKSASEEQEASDTYMERAAETVDPDLKKLYEHVTSEEQEHKEEFTDAAIAIAKGEPVQVKSAKKECVEIALMTLIAKSAEDQDSLKENISLLNLKCDCNFNAKDVEQLNSQRNVEDLMLTMALIFREEQ